MIVKVPLLFYFDHKGRDLPSGKIIKEYSKYVLVELNEDEFSELLSDAEYYSNIVKMSEDKTMLGLQLSAKATARILLKEQGIKRCGCPIDYPEKHQEGCALA